MLGSVGQHLLGQGSCLARSTSTCSAARPEEEQLGQPRPAPARQLGPKKSSSASLGHHPLGQPRPSPARPASAITRSASLGQQDPLGHKACSAARPEEEQLGHETCSANLLGLLQKHPPCLVNPSARGFTPLRSGMKIPPINRAKMAIFTPIAWRGANCLGPFLGPAHLWQSY